MGRDKLLFLMSCWLFSLPLTWHGRKKPSLIEGQHFVYYFVKTNYLQTVTQQSAENAGEKQEVIYFSEAEGEL